MGAEQAVKAAIEAGTSFVVEILDGDAVEDVCTFAELAESNGDDLDMLGAVALLSPGATHYGGGGAAAQYAIRRVDADPLASKR